MDRVIPVTPALHSQPDGVHTVRMETTTTTWPAPNLSTRRKFRGEHTPRPRCSILPDSAWHRDAYVDKTTGQPYGWTDLTARERVLVRALYREVRRRELHGSIFMARCELFGLLCRMRYVKL